MYWTDRHTWEGSGERLLAVPEGQMNTLDRVVRSSPEDKAERSSLGKDSTVKFMAVMV